MNCDQIRRRLLLTERPELPAGIVQEHLHSCSPCRAWQRRLVNLENQLALLPVPASSAGVRLARQFRESPRNRVLGFLRQPMPPKERGRRKLSLAFALAAALLVFALCWWALPHEPTIAHSPDLFAQQLLRRDLVLAKSTVPRQRVQLLSDLAESVRDEALELAQASRTDLARLQALALAYGQLVRDDLPAEARKLTEAERTPALEAVARQLIETESSVERLLATPLPTRVRGPLKEIAVAARTAQDRIRSRLVDRRSFECLTTLAIGCYNLPAAPRLSNRCSTSVRFQANARAKFGPLEV